MPLQRVCAATKSRGCRAERLQPNLAKRLERPNPETAISWIRNSPIWHIMAFTTQATYIQHLASLFLGRVPRECAELAELAPAFGATVPARQRQQAEQAGRSKRFAPTWPAKFLATHEQFRGR